jgi:drug/metabolite transporter (DMT)-like permease
MIWGILFGFVLFGDKPDILTLAGALNIVSSGLYILHRETRRMDRS